MDSSLRGNLSRYFLLWLLLPSSVYSLSQSSEVWITKTIDETVTVDCSTSTTSCTTKPSSTTVAPNHDTVSGASTTATALTGTGTSINIDGTSSNAHSTSLDTHSTSPAPSGTTSARTGKEQTKTVLPGASAVTIDGTPVSLGLSRTLVIGTHTIKLPSTSPAMEIFTIGSQTVTIMPTGFEAVLQSDTPTLPSPTATAELTVAPGGSPITIGTVPISLGPGGILVIGGSTQLIPASKTETLSVDGQNIIASFGGLIVNLPTPTTAGVTTLITGNDQFVFSTSFVSIPSLTTWSETTTELPGQTTPTVLPIWPCLSLCASGYNGVMVIPKSPLPPSTAIVPAPFSFPALTIGPDGRPTTASMTPLLTPTAPPTASATVTADSIISTMTTVPPGFSTEQITNSPWTANTWITTSSGGHPTIVPVLVGCRGCGGTHGGIILWNLPDLPRISFQIPGFPGLPKFHLPCIKIFGIRIAGDCDDPPSTDGENSNDPTSNPSHSSEGKSPSLSSTSSCTGTAAPSCTQLCRVTSASGRAVTSSCASPVCQTITACSAKPTTSTSYSVTTQTAELCAFACSMCRGPSPTRSSSGAISSRTPPDIVRRIFPTPPVSPDDTEGIIDWFNEAVIGATPLQMDGQGYQDLSSAQEFRLSSVSGQAGHYARQISVWGLYGCTVVLVATPETIYMAHIWETTYAPNSEDLFQTSALQFLAAGDPARGWVGLDSLSIPEPGQITPLAREKHATVMVFAGRDKMQLDVDQPAYSMYILRIVTYLQEKFPFQPAQLVNYKTAWNEKELHDGNHDEWGKILVQYDPAQPDCEGATHPTFRVWVEGKLFRDIRYINYGTDDPRVGRRDTSHSGCPLLPGQTGRPYEITVTASTFPGYISSTTLSTTTTSTKSATSTTSSSHSTSTSSTTTSTKSTASTTTSVTSTLRTSFITTATSKPPPCEPFQDPDAGPGHSYCQCSSGTLTTTIQMMVTTDNPCGYTTFPSAATTKAPPPPTTTAPPNPYPYTFTYDQGGVLACETVSYLQLAGSKVTYCAGDRKTLSAAPPPPTTTASAAPLTCSFCDDDFVAWTFTLSGSTLSSGGLPDLHHQMSGCGALTGWSGTGDAVKFNLPFLIKGGCVERAIGTAGGPSISCQHAGVCLTI